MKNRLAAFCMQKGGAVYGRVNGIEDKRSARMRSDSDRNMSDSAQWVPGTIN